MRTYKPTCKAGVRSRGVTLIEVLMSMLVMSIGIVAVAALFPLSVRRSVEATQLTTGTALRYTVEGMIDASGNVNLPSLNLPGSDKAAIAGDPDFNHDPAVNVIDINTFSVEKYVVDPLGYWRLREAGQSHAQASQFGNWSAVRDAAKFRYNYRFSLAPYFVADSRLREEAFKRNERDPLAFASPVPLSQKSIDYNGSGTFDMVQEWARLTEISTALPDNHTTIADAVATYNSGGTVTFPAGVADFGLFATENPPSTIPDNSALALAQVTIFSADGRRSVTRKMTFTQTGNHGQPGILDGTGRLIPGGATLAFTGGLPSWFTATAGRVIVEAEENRYSWMLTVRNRPAGGRDRDLLIDIVIFFRRTYGADVEQVYVIGRQGGDKKVTDRQVDRQEYAVTWDPNTNPPTPAPDVAVGRWIFDPANFRWHKIGTVTAEVPDPDISGNRRIVFTIEGTEEAGGENFNSGMFLPGVVDVYTVRKRIKPYGEST